MVLAEAGWDVLMLEKGANRFGDLTSPTPHTDFANDELKGNRGFEGQLPTLEPRTFRASAAEATPRVVGTVNNLPSVVGGGTVHWDAKTPRFWDIDFKKHSMLGPVDGADITDWPVTYQEMEPLYEEVERLIGVQGDAAALNVGPRGRHAPRHHAYPMPPGPAQYISARFADAASLLGLAPRARRRWPSTPSRTTAGPPAWTAGSAAASAARSTPASAGWPRCGGPC